MSATPVTFYSEGFRLVGDLYTPGGLRPDEPRAGIVLCHGYTGVQGPLPAGQRPRAHRGGYVVLAFDYKGWGESEGPRTRLAPYSRVADVQAALTFLGAQAEVDERRLGIYGTSYGGATVVWAGAVDRRVRCIVSVVGIGHGERWMRSVRRPDEWFDLLERSAADRVKRATDGESELVERSEVLLPDRQSAELAAAARRNVPSALNTLPLEYVDETLGFHPEWVVDKNRPSPDPLHHHRRRPPRAPGGVGGPSTKGPASRRGWWCSKATATTRSTRTPPSPRSWTRPSPGSGSTSRPGEGADTEAPSRPLSDRLPTGRRPSHSPGSSRPKLRAALTSAQAATRQAWHSAARSHSSSSTISKRTTLPRMAGTNSAQSFLDACSVQRSNTDRL